MKSWKNPSNLIIVCFCILKIFSKKFNFFYFFLLQINIFLVFLDHFDVLMPIIIFFKKKYYFDIFPSEKHSKKQPQPHSRTHMDVL